MYLMKWRLNGIEQEEYLRFSLVVEEEKILSDISSVEPDFNTTTYSHLPLAYAGDFEE